jgi:SAM-dependent methyltransferase
MLDQARARPGSASFGPGCAENLDFGDASFDLVFSVDVIHHLTDPARYFSEAFRVLVPGGRVCTVTDSEWVIRNRCPLAVYFPETVAPELERYPPIPTLRGLMQDAGFTGLAEELEEFPYLLYDAGPLRARVYSALQLITDRAWQRGLDRLERDLAQGPVRCVARYTLLWGHKNEGGRGQ